MTKIKSYEPTSGIGARLSEVQNLKVEIDRLTAQLDQQKAYLLGHAIRNDLDGLRSGPITLSRRERVSWTYSDSIKQAEQRLKNRKQIEQDNGIAKGVVSEHLVATFNAKVVLSSQAIGA